MTWLAIKYITHFKKNFLGVSNEWVVFYLVQRYYRCYNKYECNMKTLKYYYIRSYMRVLLKYRSSIDAVIRKGKRAITP